MPIVAEITTFTGLPAHPLVVHLPVVLVPLALLGAVLALVWSPWRSWMLPLVAVMSGLSLIGVQLAIMSGEGLEEILDEETAALERHAEMGEQARPLVLLFFAVALAAAVVITLLRRAEPTTGAGDTGDGAARRTTTLRRALVPLCAVSVLAGGLSTVAVTRAGHSGAESVWEEETGGQGTESGERDDDDHESDETDEQEDGEGG